jgi:hypothetical protein
VLLEKYAVAVLRVFIERPAPLLACDIALHHLMRGALKRLSDLIDVLFTQPHSTLPCATRATACAGKAEALSIPRPT